MSKASSGYVDAAAVRRLMMRVGDFAQGLGLDSAATKRIASEVVADMPSRLDEEREIEAQTRMLIATA